LSRIVRFRSNFTQGFGTRRPKYHKVQGQGVKGQGHSVTTGGDTYTAGAAIAAPFANMGRQHIIIAAPTLALASSDIFL